MGTYASIERADVEYLWAEAALGHLSRYFSTFTGRRFERLGGGGDRGEVRDQFTAEDLVAVSMLSVDIPGGAAIEILERRSADLDALLAQVPGGLELWDAGDEVIGPDSHAVELWKAIEAIDGCGWVTAGKLLARKRPRLIPVYDRVVRQVLDRADGEEYWRPLRDLLAGDPEVRERLAGLRETSGIGDDISLLRVFDVVTWMHGTPGAEA